MEIFKIKPQGFCKGVIRAMVLLDKSIQDDTLPRPIYILGQLVHNKHVASAYRDQGIIPISTIDNITSGTIVITAHGIADDVINAIKQKGLHLIDATCPDVRRTHVLIKEKIQEEYDVIFYGQMTHPETKGILGISQAIHLVESVEDCHRLTISNPLVMFATQTTMSYFDVMAILSVLRSLFPSLLSFEDVCTATKLRQTALIDAANNSDFVIIVGDPQSNNTNKLKEICDTYTKTPSILVENIEGLKGVDFKNYQKIAVTSGASTPIKIVDELISGIKNNDFTSHLSLLDYLKKK